VVVVVCGLFGVVILYLTRVGGDACFFFFFFLFFSTKISFIDETTNDEIVVKR